MERYPAAYVRRSYVDAASSGDVSREVQEAAIRDLAHRDGYNGDVEWYVDWGKSGSEAKASTRTRYAEMLRAVEAGRVSVVYAYSLDRLNRSLVMSARFAKACEANDVRIVTAREGEVRQDSPAEWLRWTILATFGEYELRTISARNAHAIAERRGKGGWIGRVAYGWKLERDADGVMVRVKDPAVPVDAILDAVREKGTMLGAAKLLRERGIPTPDGKAVWGNTSLRRIIEQHAPELLPKAGPTGRRQGGVSSKLSQLLVCHCATPETRRVLTPEPGRKGYRCRMAVRLGHEAHGPGYVAERAILPWIKREAARWTAPGTHAQEAPNSDTRRADLTEQRRKLALAFSRAALDDATYEAEDGRLQAELRDLDAQGVVVPIGPIDWDHWSAADINAVLRAMWRYVELGPDMRPVRAVWRTDVRSI